MSDTHRHKAEGKIARGDDWRDYFPRRRNKHGANHLARCGCPSCTDGLHRPMGHGVMEGAKCTTRTTERVMLGRLRGRLWAQDTDLEVYIPPDQVILTD